MPNIKLTLTRKITHDQKQALSNGLTDAVTVIPHKKVIILLIEDAKTFFIANKEQEDYALIELDMCGHFDLDIKSAFAKEAFAVITQVVGTPPDKIGMRITEHDAWGGFGDFLEMDKCGDPIFRQ